MGEIFKNLRAVPYRSESSWRVSLFFLTWLLIDEIKKVSNSYICNLRQYRYDH